MACNTKVDGIFSLIINEKKTLTLESTVSEFNVLSVFSRYYPVPCGTNQLEI